MNLDNGVLIALAGLAGGLIKSVSDVLIARLANSVKKQSPPPVAIPAGDALTQFFFENSKETITRLTNENAALYQKWRDSEEEVLGLRNELVYHEHAREKLADMQTVHNVYKEEIAAVATLRRIGGLHWYKREGVLDKMADVLREIVANSAPKQRALLTESPGLDGSRSYE